MKREQAAPQLLELLANDRQSQAGHMLNNLSTDPTALLREVSARTCGKVKNPHDVNAILFFYYTETSNYQNVTRQPYLQQIHVFFRRDKQTDIYFNFCYSLFVVCVGGGGVCKPFWSGVSVRDALWTASLYGVLLHRQ